MKLRNKKTGEIGELRESKAVEDSFFVALNNERRYYNSLAELNEEWEDYEEPKEYWYVYGDVVMSSDNDSYYDYIAEKMKKIGNYFATKEEAEKALEKFKAWKRLKDKGFRFIDHIDRDTGQGMTRYEWNGYINGEDLDLLFGGEK